MLLVGRQRGTAYTMEGILVFTAEITLYLPFNRAIHLLGIYFEDTQEEI